jgi:hypothetical protein
MRNAIRFMLGTTAVLALCGACARSVDATPPPKTGNSIQTPARAADNMNAGDGYNGGASENINRGTTPTAPTSIGGGPTAGESGSDTIEKPGTSGMDSTGSDMTGDVKAPDSPKDKKKSLPSTGADIK